MKQPRSHIVPLMAVVLACCAVSSCHPLAPASGWHLSVEVARIRISFGTGAAPVRDRTPLSGIGQAAAWLGLAR